MQAVPLPVFNHNHNHNHKIFILEGKNELKYEFILAFGCNSLQGRIQGGGLWGLKPPFIVRLYLINMVSIIMKFCLSIII